MARSDPRLVGIFNFAAGSIALAGPQSERAVADWLGTTQLDQTDLRESGSVLEGHELMSAGPTSATHLEPALVYALLERGGVEPDGEGWRAPDGRRTVTVGDALIGRSKESRGD